MPPTEPSQIQGWMSPGELRWLTATAAEMSSIAEVGCWRGRSTFALLSACKGPVYAVDHWKGSPDELNHAHSEAKAQDIYAQFMANVGHFPNLNVVREESPEAANLVPVVDMVFIDGCHTYPQVMADLYAWRSKARRIICGHDAGFITVRRALEEQFGEAGYANPCESIWSVLAPPPYQMVRVNGKMARATMVGMDKQCGTCGQITDASEGKCRFCGAPHPELEPEVVEEPDAGKPNGKKGKA